MSTHVLATVTASVHPLQPTSCECLADALAKNDRRRRRRRADDQTQAELVKIKVELAEALSLEGEMELAVKKLEEETAVLRAEIADATAEVSKYTALIESIAPEQERLKRDASKLSSRNERIRRKSSERAALKAKALRYVHEITPCAASSSSSTSGGISHLVRRMQVSPSKC